ncbi:MAG: hypothetical protein ACKVU2_06475, partial [Saprospiraceae bacterium]
DMNSSINRIIAILALTAISQLQLSAQTFDIGNPPSVSPAHPLTLSPSHSLTLSLSHPLTPAHSLDYDAILFKPVFQVRPDGFFGSGDGYAQPPPSGY